MWKMDEYMVGNTIRSVFSLEIEQPFFWIKKQNIAGFVKIFDVCSTEFFDRYFRPEFIKTTFYPSFERFNSKWSEMSPARLVAEFIFGITDIEKIKIFMFRIAKFFILTSVEIEESSTDANGYLVSLNGYHSYTIFKAQNSRIYQILTRVLEPTEFVWEKLCTWVLSTESTGKSGGLRKYSIKSKYLSGRN